MSLDWQYAQHRDVAILTLSGHLGGDGIARFVGGLTWVLARSTGPLLVDVTGLVSWSDEGERVVLDTARRLSGTAQPLVLCGIGDLPTPKITANRLIPLTIHPDLDTALGALTAAR